MKKRLRNSIALLLSIGICASMTTVPVSAADVKFALNEISGDSREASLIKATYTEDGVLEKAEITGVKIDAGADTYTYTTEDANDGVRYFLWDSENGMKPLAPDPTADYTVSVGEVTGGEAGDIMIVKTAANTQAPTVTSAPTAAPGPAATPEPDVNTMTPITEEYTFISDNFANGADIVSDKYLDGGKVYSPSGNKYATNKQKSTINGTEYNNSLRVKGGQQTFAVQLAYQSTIVVYSNNDTEKGRYIALGTEPGKYDIADTDGVQNILDKSVVTTFTDVPAGMVYITGLDADHNGGDLYIAGFTVTPVAAPESISAFSPLLASPADGEELVDTLTVHAGDKITVKAHKADDLKVKLTTDPETEITGPVATDEANSAEYYTFTMLAANTKVNAAYEKMTLPKDEAWTTADEELDKAVLGAVEGAQFSYNGLSGYGQWKSNGSKLTYTHTNNVTYTLPHGWEAGSGGATKRNFYFTPKQACIVTVIYTAQSDRPVYIAQGDTSKHLAEGTDGAQNGHPAVLTADIEDISKGNVYIVGGSSNKQIYGIFADYYDPNVIVNRTVSGKIDYSGSASTENTKIVFTDTKDQQKYTVDFGKNYTTELRQNRSYDISIEENGKLSDKLAVTLDTNSVAVAKLDKTHDIKVVDIEPTEVKGDVIVHEYTPNDNSTLDLSKVSLTFKDETAPTYTYTIPAGNIKEGKYAAEMMPGHTYTITASGIEGYKLSELSGSYVMTPGDTEPFKNILITENLDKVKFAEKIEVGPKKTYTKIGDAMEAIRAMTDRPAGEAGRITVLVDSGTYTEQVIVDKPYITIKAADENHKPEIQWYYGIGYLYYSSADNGYYSEDYAVAKTKKGAVARWGCAVRITDTNVNLESIIVKNTFNCFVSEAEIADGVEPSMNGEYGDVTGKPDRAVKDYKAMSQQAVERAAAIAMDADFIELYKCDFISSQDTFYTNKIGYVKDCYIEGGTDYIFGGNSIVFDGCTLAWHGYSDVEKGGYITANKNGADPVPGTPNTASNGYLLKNCTVTTSKYYPDNKFAAGGWGRNWGGAQTQVVFDGVKVDTEMPNGWTQMGGDLKNSILYVNDVKDKDGKPVDVSGKEFNPNGTMEANKYEIYNMYDYFGDWTPPHYEGDLPETPTPVSGIHYEIALNDPSKYSGSTENDPILPEVITELEENGITFGEDVKFHDNQHGTATSLQTIKIAAPGPLKIILGDCLFGANNVEVSANGAVVDKANMKSGCYHNGGYRVVLYYPGPDAAEVTVKFNSGTYLPYLKVDSISESELPQPVEEVTVTYAKSDEADVEGVVPEAQTVEVDSTVPIALNRTLYKDGYTLTGWSDGNTTYKPGDNVKVSTDITLVPVFTMNTGSAVGEVMFDFQKRNGAPKIEWQYSTNIFVSQGTAADGSPVDVKITVDTSSNGKLNNANWDDWAQCIEGTVFKVPVVKNAVVTVKDIYNGSEGTYKINGVEKTGANQSETITTDQASADIEIIDIGGYIRNFSVTYPEV